MGLLKREIMTPEKRAYLREHDSTMTRADIARTLGVSTPTVDRAAKQMELFKKYAWTDEQRQFIAERSQSMKMTKIAKYLGITPAMVRQEIERQKRASGCGNN
ncbi:positive control sigma-like factor [compost metagenome]